jgi:NADPH-dependent curcumin reductase CurA
MGPARNRQILLASRPRGWPEEGSFRLLESALPAVGDNTGAQLVKLV